MAAERYPGPTAVMRTRFDCDRRGGPPDVQRVAAPGRAGPRRLRVRAAHGIRNAWLDAVTPLVKYPDVLRPGVPLARPGRARGDGPLALGDRRRVPREPAPACRRTRVGVLRGPTHGERPPRHPPCVGAAVQGHLPA